MNKNGPIYTALLEQAKREEQPYGKEQIKVIEQTTEKLASMPTSAARPGMLLGRVQSGKTKTFLGILAMAMDNGYKLAIILTKGTNALSEQTIKRLRQAFAVPCEEDLLEIMDIIKTSPHGTSLTSWKKKQPVIFVVKKEKKNLERLMKVLFESNMFPDMATRRAMIIDDEADFASIGFKKKDEQGFSEMQTIMSMIDKLRTKLKDSSFLQVTATPYSLYLQPRDTVNEKGAYYRPIRPAFTQLVPVHSKYIGGEFYFEHRDDPKKLGSHIFVEVSQDELEILEKPDRRRFKIEEALTSPRIAALRQAVVNFVTAATIRRLQDKAEGRAIEKYSFVIHTMARKASHEWQMQIVDKLVEEIDAIAAKGSDQFAELIKTSYDGYAPSVKLAKQKMPAFEQVLAAAQENIQKLKLETVNSDKEVKELLDEDGQLRLGNALTMFIGGSILDRGLTIRNMIGFFYGRRANRFQQDTVLQHHRMYGARPLNDMAVTRLYTSRPLYEMLRTVHEFDSALRQSIEDGGDKEEVAFIRKEGKEIIPCSPNKIMASEVVTLRPGKRLLPVGIQTQYKTHGAKDLHKLDQAISEIVGDSKQPDPVLISVQQACDLLRAANDLFDNKASEVPYDVEGAMASLRYTSGQCLDANRRMKVHLLVRYDRDNVRVRESGRFFDAPDTSHVEGKIASEVAVDLPMLMLFRQNGEEARGWRGMPFYWPVIYMPQQMGTVIFASEVNDYDEDNVVPHEDK